MKKRNDCYMKKKPTILMAAGRLISSTFFHFLLTLIFIVVSGTGYAQTTRVSGVVTDGKGAPLEGATVVIKGKSTGTSTDNAGRYTLEVSGPKDVLVFTSVGHLAKEEVVGQRTIISLKMTESSSDLEGVVVIGYGGTARKKDITGSTGTVTSKQLAERVPVTLFDALQGQVAGVLVTNDNGDPNG